MDRPLHQPKGRWLACRLGVMKTSEAVEEVIQAWTPDSGW